MDSAGSIDTNPANRRPVQNYIYFLPDQELRAALNDAETLGLMRVQVAMGGIEFIRSTERIPCYIEHHSLR